jgi:ABC-type glutathione transport system ATPase component
MTGQFPAGEVGNGIKDIWFMNEIVLQIRDLTVRIGERLVIDNVSLDLCEGEVMALVGESGSGKTLTALAILDLMPSTAARKKGAIFFKGRDMLSLSAEEKRKIRGKDIAMVFQEPFTSLNPVMSSGEQIAEVLAAHTELSLFDIGRRVAELLNIVKLPDAVRHAYPHELSGGMRQRVVLAMALACRPEVLILDEPTTALDVSIQKEILDLIRDLQLVRKFAALFITHDFSVVNMIADRVAVMKDGRIVESGTKEAVLVSGRDAYTKKLIGCVPRLGDTRDRLPV